MNIHVPNRKTALKVARQDQPQFIVAGQGATCYTLIATSKILIVFMGCVDFFNTYLHVFVIFTCLRSKPYTIEASNLYDIRQ